MKIENDQIPENQLYFNCSLKWLKEKRVKIIFLKKRGQSKYFDVKINSKSFIYMSFCIYIIDTFKNRIYSGHKTASF